MATSVVGELAAWSNSSATRVTQARTPWSIVAASGAPAKVRALADYLCDGTADQVEINAALAVDDKRPVLLVGPTFNTTAAVAYTDGVHHDIIGNDEDYCSIVANHTGNAFEIHSASLPQEWRCKVSNIRVTKGASLTPARGISITNGAYLTFEKVRVDHCTTNLYGSFSNTNSFTDCTFSDGTNGVQLTGAVNQGSHKNRFNACHFRANTVGTLISTYAQSNIFDGCVYGDGTTGMVGVRFANAPTNVENNVWRDCWYEGSGTYTPFDIQGGDQITIERPFLAIASTQEPVKVSGFAGTNVRVIDTDPFTPSKWSTVPGNVTLVRSAGVGEVNVIEHGADPTGATECALAFQRAIDSLGTTGGRVTGPRGTYTFGVHTRTGWSGFFDYCLYIEPTHGPLELDFPPGTVIKATGTAATNDALLGIDSDDIAVYRTVPTLIRGITFDGNARVLSPVRVGRSHYVTFEGNVFQNGTDAQLYIGSDARNATIIRNIFYPITTDPVGAGFRSEAPGHLIAFNRVYNGTTAGVGILVADNADYVIPSEETVCIGNIIEGGFLGISVTGSNRCVVAHNTIRNITNVSSVAGIRTEPYTNSGITYSPTDHVITGNIIYNCRNGIDVFGDTVNGTKRCTFRDNRVIKGPSVNLAYGIRERGTATDYNTYEGNVVIGATTAGYTYTGTHNRVTGNRNYNTSFAVIERDDNNGTGTIPSGSTSVVITHGLGHTPTIQSISITPTNNPTNDPGNFWVSTLTTTTFTVNCRANPGTGGMTFAWAVSGAAT